MDSKFAFTAILLKIYLMMVMDFTKRIYDVDVATEKASDKRIKKKDEESIL